MPLDPLDMEIYKPLPVSQRTKLYLEVPKWADSGRIKMNLDLPSRRKSPLWYLSYPQPVIDLCGVGGINPRWWCMPAHTEEATKYRPMRRYAAYCSAPPGIRCKCGAQREGHDPGDEQD